MATCKGVLWGAGFETPAEALYLGKKLLVIPMKAQYEQRCNAAALQKMGVTVLKSLKKKHHWIIKDWINYGKIIPVNYPDLTEQIIDTIIARHFQKKIILPDITWSEPFRLSELSLVQSSGRGLKNYSIQVLTEKLA
jgi:hypothetical protein